MYTALWIVIVVLSILLIIALAAAIYFGRMIAGFVDSFGLALGWPSMFGKRKK